MRLRFPHSLAALLCFFLFLFFLRLALPNAFRERFFCFFFNFGFIYLFMAVLRLRFCARAFSSCGKWGPLFIAVRRPLIIAASLVAEHRLLDAQAQ